MAHPGAQDEDARGARCPLSSHAVAILRELHPLTGRGRYLFPGIRTATEPLSENTVNAATRRMGRPDEPRVGHECVSAVMSRWQPTRQNKNQNHRQTRER